jgi:hypothetical protein
MNTAISRPDRHASTAAVAQRPALTTVLLACGVVGPILFSVVVLVQGATRPGYNALHHPVSALSLGGNGWMQTVNFLVSGMLVLGYAVGLRQVLRPGTGSTWAPILVGICGLGYFAAGIFATDPAFGYPPGVASTQSVHGTIHTIVSNVGALSLLVACFVLARRFARTPGWRGWAVFSVVSGVLIVIFGIGSTLASSPDAPFGLLQRLTIAAGWVWMVLVAVRLLTTTLPAER